MALQVELLSKFIKVDGMAMSNNGQNEIFICSCEVVPTSSGTGVGVWIVHNARFCIATEDLVDERLFDTENSANTLGCISVVKKNWNFCFEFVGQRAWHDVGGSKKLTVKKIPHRYSWGPCSATKRTLKLKTTFHRIMKTAVSNF